LRKAHISGVSQPSGPPAKKRTEADQKDISGIFRDRESRTESRNAGTFTGAGLAECPRNTFSSRSGNATGDPPQKRSPALAGNKRRANRKSKFVSRKDNTKSAQKSQEIERHFFWITHGQTNAGFVQRLGDSYKALGADERALGTFASLTAAADAVSAAYEAAR
jgi:hypothetical protein